MQQSIVGKPEEMEKNYETLKGLIASADEFDGCISKEDASQLLGRIKEAIEGCEESVRAFYLLSLDHLFRRSKKQNSVFDLKAIVSFQQCLVETIIAMRSSKANKSQRTKLWQLLE